MQNEQKITVEQADADEMKDGMVVDYYDDGVGCVVFARCPIDDDCDAC